MREVVISKTQRSSCACRRTKPITHHPKPKTQNPSPITQNPKPKTQNPKPITQNPSPNCHPALVEGPHLSSLLSPPGTVILSLSKDKTHHLINSLFYKIFIGFIKFFKLVHGFFEKKENILPGIFIMDIKITFVWNINSVNNFPIVQ